ncbi:MAG: T9SS type A sorting domain-containing protein, partial [Ginsengibacter sp.]
NGATDPVVFGFTTAPNIIDNQSDASGTQAIQAADITLTTSALAAADINQGTSNNIIYAAQMSVATEPVVVNNIQFAFSGTQDANDLVIISIYFNPAAPTIAGSTLLNNSPATFASGHSYNIPLSSSMAIGSSGYFIIALNVNPTATDNNTVKINGATDPVVFGFTTAPNIINNQSDAAGIKTIQASDISVNTSPIAASNFQPGSSNNIVYVAQLSVATEPVVVNDIQFTLNGTFDADDLTIASIYFNPSTPTITGSTLLNNTVATFPPGHSYNIALSNGMVFPSVGYYIIAVNVSATATIGNTVQINGAANPVIFGFTTAPNITNTQTDIGGIHTLPVDFINIGASASTGTVEVVWTIGTEVNVDKYIIERCGDGSSFTSIGQIKATNAGTGIIKYTLLDMRPLAGNNFYRISAIDKEGHVVYSPVVKISPGKVKENIAIYPNPVARDRRATLELRDLPRENYRVTMFNSQGQLVMQQVIQHEGGTRVQTIDVQKLPAGIYTIQVRSRNNQFLKRLLVE